MDNTLLLIMLVASSMEMAICLGCFMVLLQFRHQSWDLARRILAFLTIFCGIMAFYRVFVIVHSPLQNGFTELLPPANVLLVLITQGFLYFYPRTLMEPTWLRWNNPRVYWLVVPLVLITIGFLLFIGQWTKLHAFQDIMETMSKPDVLIRVVALDMMLPFSIIYLFLPYNWRQSGASLSWIRLYSVGAFGFFVLHTVFFLTGYLQLRIVQQLWEMAFMIITCNFELQDRFIPKSPTIEDTPSDPMEESWGETSLWDRVCVLIEKDQVWRNPDLTLPLMAQFCGTNITYLSNAIKENTGGGFNTYINKVRIQFVTDAMRKDPRQDIQQLCYEAGYRSRTTAWRNFKEIVGVTPTEFRLSLTK